MTICNISKRRTPIYNVPNRVVEQIRFHDCATKIQSSTQMQSIAVLEIIVSSDFLPILIPDI